MSYWQQIVGGGSFHWRAMLTTDKLQPVLTNVLIRSIFSTKVSQGSVATRLRYGWFFND